MRKAVDLLVQYATYHRDQRNIVTHFVGVPLIVLAVVVLLARPVLATNGLTVTPAVIGFALAALWYLVRRHLLLALATLTWIGVLELVGHRLSADTGTGAWLAWGVGLFVVGW